MINYLKEFEEALDDFLNLSIYFNENEIRYKFQGIWLSSNYENEIEKKVEKLKLLLSRQLKNGLDNNSLLTEVKSRMHEAYNFLYDVYYDDFDNLSKSNLQIKKSLIIADRNHVDAWEFELFKKDLNTPDDGKENEGNEVHSWLLKFFEEYRIENNVNPSKLQFENAKLLACVYFYREELFSLLSTLDYYIQNFDKIDFSKLDVSINVEDLPKCHSSLNKLKTAQLFKFLVDEKYLFMDKQNAVKNETMVKRFLAANFTFNKNGTQSDIGQINQEFSELKWQHQEIQVDLIDELIGKLEDRKKLILDFRKPKSK